MSYEDVQNATPDVVGRDPLLLSELELWDRVDRLFEMDDDTLAQVADQGLVVLDRAGVALWKGGSKSRHVRRQKDLLVLTEHIKALMPKAEPAPPPPKRRKSPELQVHAPAPAPEPVQQASNTAPLTADTDQIHLFFELLGKEQRSACFRAFMHKSNPKKVGDSGRKRNGFNLAEFQGWQKEQRSIYVVVNDGGQKASEITTCRALFCEWDGATRAEQLKQLERMISLGLPAPTFAVWTGGHDTASLHTYWVLETPQTSVLLWRWMMWRLIEVADSDRAIEDPSRVMRLPGFHYIDGAGVDLGAAVIETAHCTGQKVTVEEMNGGLNGAERALFGEPISHLFVPDKDSTKRSRAIGFTNKPDQRKELLNLLSEVYEPEYAEAVDVAIQNKGGTQPSLSTATSAKTPDNKEQPEQTAEFKRLLSPERAAEFAKEDAANSERSDALRALGWIKEHKDTWTVASIKAALDCFPSRAGAGSGTYTIYRDLLAGMRVALKHAIDLDGRDPTDLAYELMFAHSPSGWDIRQVLDTYGNDWTEAGGFWWWVTEKGYRPEGDEWKNFVSVIDHEDRELRFLSDKWKLTVMVQEEASSIAIESFLASTDNQWRLRQVLKAELEERERNLDAADVIERLQKGQVGAADTDLDLSFDLGDYFTSRIIDTMDVLRHGYGFNDHAIAMISVCGVSAAIPPDVRIKTRSMSQPIVLWGGLIGTTGVSKSALLEHCIETPYRKALATHLDVLNRSRSESWQNSCKENKEQGGSGRLPRPRKMSWIATPGGSAQGIQADLADHGALMPKLMLADELTGLLEQISCPVVGQSDEPFWNSSYDQRFTSVTFADESKNRTVDKGKVSLIGGIQPKVLERLMKPDSISSGFWGRWLMAHQASLRKHLIEDPYEGDFVGIMASTYMKLTPGAVNSSELLPGMEGGDYTLQLDREAGELFMKIFDHCETLRLEASTDGLEGLYAKASAQVLRAAAPIQLMRYLWGLDTPPTWEEVRGMVSMTPNIIRVGPKALMAAYQLVMKGKQLSADAHLAVEDPMAAAASKLVATTERLQAKANGKPVSLRDVRRSMTGGKSKLQLSGDDLLALVRRMGNQGLLIWDEKGKKVAVPVHLPLR